MTIDSIEDVIRKTKEKVNKNSKYLHPMNKELQEDAKMFGFPSTGRYIVWLQQNGILKNPTDVHREKYKNAYKNWKEYADKNAQRAGYKDYNERQREYRHRTGKQLPIGDNEDGPIWFGDFVENLMIHRYPLAVKMPYGNPGFDYLWKKDGIEIKIQCKGRCLRHTDDNWVGWIYKILYNNIADIFIFSGWDNRKSLNPMYAWEFSKNDLVRYGQGTNAPKVEFWKREGITINYPGGLKQFIEYQIDIDWLKNICKKEKMAHNRL